MNRKIRAGAILPLFLLCGSSAEATWEDHLASVHFNSAQPDFGLPPRRASTRAEEADIRPTGMGTDNYGGGSTDNWELSPDRDEQWHINRRVQRDKALALARTAITQKHWREVKRALSAVVERFGDDGGLRDRAELLDRGPVFAPYAGRYFDALKELESDSASNAAPALKKLVNDSAVPEVVREHATYQLACLSAQKEDYPGAIRAWQSQLQRFPRGEKREAALIMIARAALFHEVLKEGADTATGRAAVQQLLRSFPKTRFATAAKGLIARSVMQDGDYQKAARLYCQLGDGNSARVASGGSWPWLELVANLRQLDSATKSYHYRDAVRNIADSLGKLPPVQGKAFLKRLYADPALAAPYLYYRLYHCTNTPADIERLTELADELQRRNRTSHLSPVVRVRLAETYYQKRQLRKAIFWAGQSVEITDENTRARALYVRAGCRYRQNRLQSARRDLNRLLNTCPKSGLRHGARELLALVAEGQKDFTTALDQYLAIGYREDAAYLIDARMPIASLRQSLREHPGRRGLLGYSLALRYLRIEKWDAARACLARLKPADYAWLIRPSGGYYEEDFYSEGANPKATLARLEPLHRAVRQARTREERAAAMYAYARVYYTAGLLQFYNAPLWQGGRMWNFTRNWNESALHPRDKVAVQRYMYQHEVYAHARRLCLDIARLYPETPTAPLALYRAACASDRLAGFNDWWDDTNPAVDHVKESSQLMARLVNRYPKHPLAPKARKYASVFQGEHVAPGEPEKALTPEEASPE